MKSKPLVSVIIPTRNSAEYLEQCLKSVQSQTYPQIEIIVVDNNSTDSTNKIAKKYTKSVFNIGPERSSQRNYGVKTSRGTLVAIIDSDMILSKTVISDCVDAFKKADVNIAQLIIPESSMGIGFWAGVKAFEREFYVGDETIEAPRFFMKSIFNQAGGYDEHIRGGGEEYDLPDKITKLGYKTGRIQSFIVHLEGNLSLLETIRTKYYYGQTSYHYLRNHPRSAAKKFNILRPVYFRKWKKFFLHPILSIAMIIMKASEFTAGAAGLLKGIYEKHT